MSQKISSWFPVGQLQLQSFGLQLPAKMSISHINELYSRGFRAIEGVAFVGPNVQMIEITETKIIKILFILN